MHVSSASTYLSSFQQKRVLPKMNKNIRIAIKAIATLALAFILHKVQMAPHAFTLLTTGLLLKPEFLNEWNYFSPVFAGQGLYMGYCAMKWAALVGTKGSFHPVRCVAEFAVQAVVAGLLLLKSKELFDKGR